VLLQRKEISKEMISTLTATRVDGIHTTKWDTRLYGIGAQILRDIGVRKMRLMMTPRKMPSMAGFDLEICGYLQPEEAEETLGT
jgi:3,4-dihydroxy 2-butanone 4-phosphate synthase / GTP cyclohydrolase II